MGARDEGNVEARWRRRDCDYQVVGRRLVEHDRAVVPPVVTLEHDLHVWRRRFGGTGGELALVVSRV